MKNYFLLLGLCVCSMGAHGQTYHDHEIELGAGTRFSIMSNEAEMVSFNRYHSKSAFGTTLDFTYWYAPLPQLQLGANVSYYAPQSYQQNYANYSTNPNDNFASYMKGSDYQDEMKLGYGVAAFKARYKFLNESNLVPYVEMKIGGAFAPSVRNYDFSSYSSATSSYTRMNSRVEDTHGGIAWGVGFGVLLKENFKVGLNYSFARMGTDTYVDMGQLFNLPDFDKNSTINIRDYAYKDHSFELSLAYVFGISPKKTATLDEGTLFESRKGLRISAGPSYVNFKSTYRHYAEVISNPQINSNSSMPSHYQQSDPVFDISLEYALPWGKSFDFGVGVSYLTPSTYSWTSYVSGTKAMEDGSSTVGGKDFWYTFKYSRLMPYAFVQYNLNNVPFAPYIKGKVGPSIAFVSEQDKQHDEEWHNQAESNRGCNIGGGIAMGCRLSNHFGLELGAELANLEFAQTYMAYDRQKRERNQSDTVNSLMYALNLRAIYFF